MQAAGSQALTKGQGSTERAQHQVEQGAQGILSRGPYRDALYSFSIARERVSIINARSLFTKMLFELGRIDGFVPANFLRDGSHESWENPVAALVVLDGRNVIQK